MSNKGQGVLEHLEKKLYSVSNYKELATYEVALRLKNTKLFSDETDIFTAWLSFMNYLGLLPRKLKATVGSNLIAKPRIKDQFIKIINEDPALLTKLAGLRLGARSPEIRILSHTSTTRKAAQDSFWKTLLPHISRKNPNVKRTFTV